jgi:formylglycine-generating enzyme required for sulfatase activity
MVRIPAGSFLMGSPDTERSRQADEGPVHQVTIGYDFYLGETEVTQGQWEAVMGYNAATHSPEGTPYLTSFGVGRDYPVYKVSWDDCQAFLAGLNALGQGTFRLPSEAEWEYACRAGSTTRFYFGDSLGCFDACEDCDADPTIRGKRFPPELTGNPMEFEPKIVIPIELKRSDFMWYCGNSGGSSQPVRQKFANGFGLYDMHGNLWEWCQDLYRSDYDFEGIPIDGSAWESGGGDGTRVIRGGGWTGAAGYCRSAVRFRSDPTARHSDVGVRVVAPVSP